MKKFLTSSWGKLAGSLVTIAGLTLGGVYTYEQGAQQACKAVVEAGFSSFGSADNQSDNPLENSTQGSINE